MVLNVGAMCESGKYGKHGGNGKKSLVPLIIVLFAPLASKTQIKLNVFPAVHFGVIFAKIRLFVPSLVSIRRFHYPARDCSVSSRGKRFRLFTVRPSAAASPASSAPDLRLVTIFPFFRCLVRRNTVIYIHMANKRGNGGGRGETESNMN